MGTPDTTKCALCSGLIVLSRDSVVFGHGKMLHTACWRVHVSEERQRESQRLIRASRELRDAARKTMKPPPKPE